MFGLLKGKSKKLAHQIDTIIRLGDLLLKKEEYFGGNVSTVLS